MLGLVLLGVMLTNVWQQGRLANVVLTADEQAPDPQASAIQWAGRDFQSRWFGSPALWQPPPTDNTDFKFFDVRGANQADLIRSLDAADICKTYGPCLPDPANPNQSGIAWGLAGLEPGGYYECYSPRTTTLRYREYILLPRWSPLPVGGVSVTLVERWNALEKSIYVHEAGHVAIDIQDITALNAQAHSLPNCQALFDFWNNPHVFDKLDADQNAYHARLRADCRPEVGCFYAGWMGW